MTDVINKPMRNVWRTKKRMFEKNSAPSVSVSLVGLKSWIKTGRAWSTAQTNAVESRSMRVSSIKNKMIPNAKNTISCVKIA